ncbi:MAG: hypothetical protein KAQ71_06040, partial [Desulfobulbaceae bacterium]|nr:hypothetical protein [Desulfobulbaceae bacterium]
MISVALPKQIRGSFGAKLLLIMILLISALSLLFNLFLFQQQRSSYHQHLTKTGTAMAGMLAESIMVEVFAENIEGLKSPVDTVFNQDNVLGVAVFNHQKELLYYLEKKEYSGDSSGWQEMLKRLGNSSDLLAETKDAFVFLHSISYSISPGSEEGLYFRNGGHEAAVQDIGYVALALSPKSEQAAMKNALSQTVFSTIVFLLFGVALTFLVVRRMTAPLSSLLRKVRASADSQ